MVIYLASFCFSVYVIQKRGIPDLCRESLNPFLVSFPVITLFLLLRGVLVHNSGGNGGWILRMSDLAMLLLFALPATVYYLQNWKMKHVSAKLMLIIAVALLLLSTGLLFIELDRSHMLMVEGAKVVLTILNLTLFILVLRNSYRNRYGFSLNTEIYSRAETDKKNGAYSGVNPCDNFGVNVGQNIDLNARPNVAAGTGLIYNSNGRNFGDNTSENKGRNIIESRKIEDLKERLLSYFEKEKPYLKADLTIHEVSLYLYSNKTYLSRVINEQFNSNFNQFVNYYRVEEAKRLYKSNTNLSVHQICDMAGFGSMATFCIAFRYYVGNSPAEWCKEQRIRHDGALQRIL